MALGYLFISFIVMFIISVVNVALLYLLKNEKAKNIVFYVLAIWSIFIVIINVTALPNNFLFQRLMAGAVGLLSVLGMAINIKTPENKGAARILVTISVVLGLLMLYF